MEYYSQINRVEPMGGCCERHDESCLGTHEAATNIGVSGASPPDHAGAGCEDTPLAENGTKELPLKTILKLQEALWLVQEELSEEQRQRAEERRQFAIFQDDYLRLQEESASTSRRFTAAEVCAEVSRSLARDALEDKEYFARLLHQTQRQLHYLTAFVEEMIPRFNAKIRKLIEQGNTLVALLARHWPEENLRREIEAVGALDQPLARWALLHALKTRDASLTNAVEVQEKSSDPSKMLPQAGEVAMAALQVKTEGDFTEDQDSERNHRVGMTDCCRLVQSQQACQTSQGSIGGVAQQLERPSSRMHLSSSAATEKPLDTKTCVAVPKSLKEKIKVVNSRPPSAVTRPRLQAATPRKTKLVDAAVHLTPRVSRHNLPPLPLGKSAAYAAVGATFREFHLPSRQGALPKRDAHLEPALTGRENCTAGTASTGKKASVRKARHFRENHRLHPRETQGHTTRPASAQSTSRESVKQSREALAHNSSSRFLGVGDNLRSTQPSSLHAALRIGSQPSRKTCGALVVNNKELGRRESVVDFLKDPEEESIAKKLLQDMSRLIQINTSKPVSGSQGVPHVTHAPQAPSKKKLPPLPPLPPSLRQHVNIQGDDTDPFSQSSSGTNSTVASPEVNCNMKSPSSSTSSHRLLEAAVPFVPETQSCGVAQAKDTLVEQPAACSGEETEEKATWDVAMMQNKASGPLQEPTPSRTPVVSHWQVPQRHDGFNSGDLCCPVAVSASDKGLNRSLEAVVDVEKQPWLKAGGPASQPPLPPLSKTGMQGASLDVPKQQKVTVSRKTCEASPVVASTVVQRATPVPQQHMLPAGPPGIPSKGIPGPYYAVPGRSSLPASYTKGIQMQGREQLAQQVGATQWHSGALPWLTHSNPQRQILVPSDPCYYGLQQQYLLQQHLNIRQQQLFYQAQQARQAHQPVHFQQNNAANLHYFIGGARSTFSPTHGRPTWNVVPSCGVRR